MKPRTRFIILSQPRTGSTLLAELLDSHSMIRCDGEILSPNAGYYPRWTLGPAGRFTWTYVALYGLRSPKPVWGAKLMVYEARNLAITIKRLRQLGYRFIHLCREDVLRSALSDIIARKTRHWHRTKHSKAPEHVIRVTRDELQEHLRKRRQWSNAESNALDGSDCFRMVYEHDLRQEATRDRCMAPLLDYLGVSQEPLSASLETTDVRPLRAVIENFDEVVTMVAQSRWAPLLERFDAEA